MTHSYVWYDSRAKTTQSFRLVLVERASVRIRTQFYQTHFKECRKAILGNTWQCCRLFAMLQITRNVADYSQCCRLLAMLQINRNVADYSQCCRLLKIKYQELHFKPLFSRKQLERRGYRQTNLVLILFSQVPRLYLWERKTFLWLKMMNPQPQHMQKWEIVDFQKIQNGYKPTKKT